MGYRLLPHQNRCTIVHAKKSTPTSLPLCFLAGKASKRLYVMHVNLNRLSLARTRTREKKVAENRSRPVPSFLTEACSGREGLQQAEKMKCCSDSRQSKLRGASHRNTHTRRRHPPRNYSPRSPIFPRPRLPHSAARTTLEKDTSCSATWASRRKYLPLLPPVPRSRRSEALSSVLSSLLGTAVYDVAVALSGEARWQSHNFFL